MGLLIGFFTGLRISKPTAHIQPNGQGIISMLHHRHRIDVLPNPPVMER